MIYDKRESNYYISEEARVKLNMSVALENINQKHQDTLSMMLFQEQKPQQDLLDKVLQMLLVLQLAKVCLHQTSTQKTFNFSTITPIAIAVTVA